MDKKVLRFVQRYYMISERRREYMRKYRAEHREERKKYFSEHREERREYMKNRYAEHKEEHKEKRNEYYRNRYAEHREERQDYMSKYNAKNLNSFGVKKSNIREMSRKILEKCHSKLPNYEIHHCFGYEDPDKFIYIPKYLHLQIHQLLRDKKIPSESDHWFSIRDLVNSCEEYTYIRA